ncbi:MAG TPA: cation:dicarboxylase symporter family transporter [Gammaproteobacteria bacterium]|nr:cation:dicarboxylase symporter family transporter [Gammaproteobacteria bacterium]
MFFLKFKLPKINLSIQLVSVLVFALLFGSWLPETVQSSCYAISLTLKSILSFVLPAVIFSCLFSCLLTFKGKKAIGFMLGLLVIVCISNYLSTLIAYGISSLKLVALNLNTVDSTLPIKELQPLWHFELPTWLPNDYALYLGFGLGAIFTFFPTPRILRLSAQAKNSVIWFLEKCFIPVLPLFALGFILKMQYDGTLTQIIESYLLLLFIIVGIYVTYLLFLFGLASNFKLKLWLNYLKNIFPVALMGFSTMSSLATMPVTLNAAEKNTGAIDISRAVIPATVNTHMVGVSIAIPLMALTILLGYGHPLPSFGTYCLFALKFVIAQLSVAAIPGGAILVMLPTLETHLGFTGEMSALITALYILFDPAVTITNVLGNSALVIFISKWFKGFTTTEDNKPIGQTNPINQPL